MISGFVCVKKPSGISSFDVIRQLKRVTSISKIGHAGTLDPFASGLMICAIGREFTKRISFFQNMPKTYTFEMQFGSQTDTLDPMGQVIIEYFQLRDMQKLCKSLEFQSRFTTLLENCVARFTGAFLQLPPIFSAKKINGKRAYALARKGKTVTLDPVEVTIYNSYIHDICFSPNLTSTIEVTCSKGTYIRSLVRDIGQSVGFFGTTIRLVRDKIGDYSQEKAVSLEGLNLEKLLPYLFN